MAGWRKQEEGVMSAFAMAAAMLEHRQAEATAAMVSALSQIVKDNTSVSMTSIPFDAREADTSGKKRQRVKLPPSELQLVARHCNRDIVVGGVSAPSSPVAKEEHTIRLQRLQLEMEKPQIYHGIRKRPWGNGRRRYGTLIRPHMPGLALLTHPKAANQAYDKAALDFGCNRAKLNFQENTVHQVHSAQPQLSVPEDFSRFQSSGEKQTFPQPSRRTGNVLPDYNWLEY